MGRLRGASAPLSSPPPLLEGEGDKGGEVSLIIWTSTASFCLYKGLL